MQMIDSTEDNEFRKLLSDYITPFKDEGFSTHVMAQIPSEQNARPTHVKPLLIGGAALIAAPQVQNLIHLVLEIKLPQMLDISKFSGVSASQNLWLNLSTPSLAILALMTMVIAWLAEAFLFANEV